MAEDEEETHMVDISKFKMEGDSNMGDIINSAKTVGQLLGNVSTVLEHGDRIKHTGSDYAKMVGTLGMMLGSVVDGLKESKAHHEKELMLPSEINAQLKGQISELESAKENKELQKKLDALAEEVMKLPTKKLPDNQEDLEASIMKKQKEIEKARKKLTKIKKSKKS